MYFSEKNFKNYTIEEVKKLLIKRISESIERGDSDKEILKFLEAGTSLTLEFFFWDLK